MNQAFPYLLLYVLGLGIFFLELFIPSGGLIGVGATICVIYALYELYQIQPAVAWIGVAFTLAYLFFLIRWGIRRVKMDTDLAGGVATGRDVREAQQMIGQSGTALTALRPAGVASIEGRKFDVVTRGGFLEPGAPLVVVEATGNRIVVQPAPRETPAP